MKTKLNEEIGERIRAKRLACKLTQDKLSEQVGISGKHLSEVERGNDRLSYEKLICNDLCQEVN